MKIWVVGRGYPTPANKMWGSFELEQARLLARNGHDVSYIALTLSFFNRKDPRGMRIFDEDGVKVYAYSHLYFPGKFGVYWEGFEDKCWRLLYSKVEAVSGLPDIIHIHYPSMLSGVNVIESYRTRGVRIFVTEHWSRVLINTINKHERKRLQYYASHANCFACVSTALQDAVKKLTQTTVPMEIIPNIVSPVFFNEKNMSPSDKFTFVTVGRLVSLKQFDAVIKQFLRVFSDNQSVRLKVIGSGSERSQLEKLSGNDPRITFLGSLSLENVAHEIAQSNALVSFSKYETFAVPVAEAWACGKPAIVSKESGVASYVKKELGFVVPSNDSDLLGDILKKIYEQYEIYDAEYIRNSAEKSFSDAAIADRLNQMYTNY